MYVSRIQVFDKGVGKGRLQRRDRIIRSERQLSFEAADLIPPPRSTTFEVQDRPYVTILKSVPAILERPEPTPDVFAPPTGNSWRGESLFIADLGLPIAD